MVRAIGRAGVLIGLAGILGFAVVVAASREGQESAPAPSAGVGHAMAAGQSMLFVPAAAHWGGAVGTNWRTDLEVHNPGSAQASYSLLMLKRDTDNSSPVTKSYTIAAGAARRFSDIVLAEFGFQGAAAFAVRVNSGSLVVASRTYNQLSAGNAWGLPAGSSFSQFVPALPEGQAIAYGEQGRLIQLGHDPSLATGYRANVGFVNATASPINLTIELRAASNGALYKTLTASLRAYEYKQIDAVFGSTTVADGYAVLRTTTPGGRFFAYASVIDNRTGDPICIPAARLAGGSTPQPTATATARPSPTATARPTATPTSSPAGVNLVPYAPSGWSYPVVPDYYTGTHTTSFLSAHYNTYVDWAVRNAGPADITGDIHFELRVDGVRRTGWVVSGGLRAGYYAYVEDYNIPYSTLTAGSHSLSIVADYDGRISESNENDNTFTRSWEWSAIMFSPAGAPPAPAPAREGTGIVRVAPVPQVALERAVAGDVLYIGTSAHWGGAAGTNWRTDLEVHNAGATQASYSVALLKRDTDNTSPVAKSYTLNPGLATRYTDVVQGMFGFAGAAALRVTVNSGTLVVTSRTYNQVAAGNQWNLPAGATYSQFVPALPQGDAIAYGEEGRLIQLGHNPSLSTGYRTNIGFVNTTGSPMNLTIELRAASNGSLYKTVTASLRAYEYKQIDGIFGSTTVSDGYAVLRTTTPGGRFFAYASVIDNRTGDPVCVPAARLSAGASPTPTPTATPASGAPMGPLSTVTDIFTILGTAGSEGRPTIESAVRDLQTYGISAIINNYASQYPAIVSAIASGARMNFGSGTTLDDGTVLAGTITATYSNLTVTSTRVSGTVTLNLSGFTKNGAPSGVQTATVQVNTTVSATGKVAGTLTISGSGTSSAGTTTISGTVQLDTAVCARYPTGGTVTVVQGGKTSTITFNRNCDGSFGYTGTGLSYYHFELRPMKCDGSAYSGWGVKPGLAAELGTIVVNPMCTSEHGPRDHRVSGTISPSAVRFGFASWYGDHYYQGAFSGTSSNGVLYPGTATYSVTVYNVAHDPESGVRCQSGVFTSRAGDTTLMLNNSSPCNF